MGFPYNPVLSLFFVLFFFVKVSKHLHFSHVEVTPVIRAIRFVGSLIVYHVVCKMFILVHCTQLELRDFGHTRSNNS